MMNLKNISNEIKEKYAVGFTRFQNIIRQLEPDIDDMPMTTLQRIKTRLYHMGVRLQEISLFPSEIIDNELVMLHMAMKDYAAIFESYYPLPTKIRRKVYVEMSRTANLFAKAKGFFRKKYLALPVEQEFIQKTGLRLVELSFEMYQWHLNFEKNQDESTSGSS